MLLKGSEVLDRQWMRAIPDSRGNGFSEEYLISHYTATAASTEYLKETNEINRLLTVDMVLKRAMKGKIDLMGLAMAVSRADRHP